MSGKRSICMAAIAALALGAGLLISDGSSQATTFRPLVGPVTLSDYTLGANGDITIPFTLEAPDAQFGTYVLALASPEFIHSDVTDGKTVGYLLADAMLGLVNQGCLSPVIVNFRLVEASTDNSPGNEASPVGPNPSPFQNFTEDDGDIHNDKQTLLNGSHSAGATQLFVGSSSGFVVSEDVYIGSFGSPTQEIKTIASIPDATHINLTSALANSHNSLEIVVTPDDTARAGNGIADGAEWYPEFLNTMFAGQTPAHRYFGWQTVPGTPSRVIIQIVMFEPGDLYNVPSIPSSELLTAAQGAPSLVILNDPTAVQPQAIEDFCTPLVTTTILCGMTDSDPDNPQSVDPDCDVGTGSEVRGTNPSSPGTYFLRTAALAQRDADDDGIENWLDPCPLSGNPDNWDPRVTIATNQANGADDDGDNIPNVCDPEFDVPGETDMHDQDEDGWYNRVDNCPLVPNASAVMTTPNQEQLDFDISGGSAVPDGGPPIDFIGPECDPHPTSPDGHYHLALTVDHMCLGGTDVDMDGVCSTYPGENDSNEDTDGDGVLDDYDNCIGDANPNPAGLTQMSPDFNGNGIVQIDDVSYVAGKFGRSTGQNGYRAAAELASQNGIIQIDDVSEAAGSFGSNC
jgi:hypothetical protein